MKIEKSKRKTIAIIITKEGDLIVRAPNFATDRQIKKFVREKEGWILKKQAQAQKKKNQEGPIKLVGQNKEKLSINQKWIFENEVGEHIISQDLANNEFASTDELGKAVKPKLLQLLTLRMAYYSNVLEIEPPPISITKARTRWGSCSGKNHINFTWRLAFLPIEVMDYIVVHELCHVIHKNHQQEYWNLVYSLCPEYKQCRRWLKDNSNIMDI